MLKANVLLFILQYHDTHGAVWLMGKLVECNATTGESINYRTLKPKNQFINIRIAASSSSSKPIRSQSNFN